MTQNEIAANPKGWVKFDDILEQLNTAIARVDNSVSSIFQKTDVITLLREVWDDFNGEDVEQSDDVYEEGQVRQAIKDAVDGVASKLKDISEGIGQDLRALEGEFGEQYIDSMMP